jgi:hypothetical protein
MLRKTTPSKTKYKDLFPSKCTIWMTVTTMNHFGEAEDENPIFEADIFMSSTHAAKAEAEERK